MPFRTLEGKALAKAVRLNPKYAFQTGWVDAFDIVVAVLGLSTPNPTPQDFANAVFGWQLNHNILKADGILGPNTWDQIQCAPIPPMRAPVSAPGFVQNAPAKEVKKGTAGNKPNSGCWVGLLLDVGVFAGAAGYNYCAGTMYSVDDRARSFDAISDRVRIGVGAGGGIGGAIAIVSNVYQKNQLRGVTTEGYDINLSLGAKWSAMAKGAIATGRFIKLADKFAEFQKAGVAGKGMIEAMKHHVRQAAKLTPDEYYALVKCVREEYNTLEGMEKNDGPNVYTLSLPLPGSLEASLFYQNDKWSVEPSTAVF